VLGVVSLVVAGASALGGGMLLQPGPASSPVASDGFSGGVTVTDGDRFVGRPQALAPAAAGTATAGPVVQHASPGADPIIRGGRTTRPVATSAGVTTDARSRPEQLVEQQADRRAVALNRLVVRVRARDQQLERERAEARAAAREERAELAAAWTAPLATYVLTARWGQVGAYWATYHTGLDFSAASGTPIVSVAAGTVTYVGYDSAYGNRTEITLEDGTVIWYAHQASQVVSTGDVVAPGELIGYVGATGNVTGPHLHLEVRSPDGSDLDPSTVLAEHGVAL
jgi:murein DD-endopeptidase MepM/ murein hydrolase activator NlpD